MPTLTVLDVIAAAALADEEVWGLRICQSSGLGTGTVYPILERLQAAGWIDASWEEGQPSGRPRRRFYALTEAGRLGRAEAHAKRAGRQRGGLLALPKQLGLSER
jgi:DNA-binding transcriptional regulator PaaX